MGIHFNKKKRLQKTMADKDFTANLDLSKDC